MKRKLLCGGALLILATVMVGHLGCQSAQQAYCRTFSNWFLEKNQYTIKTPYGTFHYRHSEDAAAREEKVTFGYGFDERILTDLGCDGQVDTVEYKRQRYLRGDKGTDEIFAAADEQMAYYKEKMLAAQAHEAWQTKRADDIARQGGFFKK